MAKKLGATLFLLMAGIWLPGMDVERSGPSTQAEAKKIAPGQMTNQHMDRLLRFAATVQEGQPGYWSVTFQGFPMLVVTDEDHNRMRIMAPVIEVEKLEKEQLIRLMEANFETALDARYAIYNGLLWSVFIHPLAELSGNQFLDALAQVKQLAESYGTTYSSTSVILNPEQ